MDELTPAQQAFENQLIESPTVKKLHEADKEIIKDLEGLKSGQKSLGDFVSEGFAKGKDRMDGLETMFKDHINTTKENHRETMSSYTDLKTEIRDQKITELKNELKDRKSSDSSLKNDIIKIAILTVIGAVGYLFIKAYG